MIQWKCTLKNFNDNRMVDNYWNKIIRRGKSNSKKQKWQLQLMWNIKIVIYSEKWRIVLQKHIKTNKNLIFDHTSYLIPYTHTHTHTHTVGWRNVKNGASWKEYWLQEILMIKWGVELTELIRLCISREFKITKTTRPIHESMYNFVKLVSR